MDSPGAVVRPVADRRAVAGVGRHARLELVFGRRNGRTVIRHAYAEPPFRAGRCFADDDGAHMIMASSAPGMFGGDNFTQHIVVEHGARVRLTSQSALQAHPSPNCEPAHLVSAYVVEDDAELTCEWDPLIPFAGARFDQRIVVRLAERARFVWSDALMSGRAFATSPGSGSGVASAGGERWAFAELSHELKVSRGASLEYLERYQLTPQHRQISRTWAAADACYFGTTLSSGQSVEAGRATDLHTNLKRIRAVRAAADRLDVHLLLVRLTAASGVAFREARALVRKALIESSPGLTRPVTVSIV